jgi:hypothetical protein
MTKRISFSFSQYDEDNAPEFATLSEIVATHEFDENSTWDVVMEDFVKFLSHCWGYDIGKKVSYETFGDRLKKMHDEGKLSEEDWDEIKGW